MQTVVLTQAEAAAMLGSNRSSVRTPSPWRPERQFTLVGGTYVRFVDESDATKTKTVLGFTLRAVDNNVEYPMTISTCATPRYDANGLEVAVPNNNFGDLIAQALANTAAYRTDQDVVNFITSTVGTRTLTVHRQTPCVNYSGRNMLAVAVSF